MALVVSFGLNQTLMKVCNSIERKERKRKKTKGKERKEDAKLKTNRKKQSKIQWERKEKK